MKPKLLIFDVNETLLDLSVLKSRINAMLDDSKAFEDWFSKLIQMAMVETLTDTYSDFGDIGLATLKMTAEKHSTFVSEEELKRCLNLIKKLEPHPEVKTALKKLTSNGFRLVALTNGGSETLKQQMKYSGLGVLLEGLYSVEAVRKFKPHPDAYRHVLAREKTASEEAMLVAAHAWDIAGAQQAGMQTAFIQRPGKFIYPKVKPPQLLCKDFTELCEKLIALD
ncbi:haloacid dehalogenase type II [Psychroflexus sp. CAK1W]|uniref:haloacid dehalogenase type II n=1 Tax=Psychroflexus curvus TaxID=2873595 RepID=UPI001CC90607|nr:haloacid dehalogenase type II [Psychroflexus curvus]MBZ9628866.1 haloacid dehalogenase type II [Psychroflexus curvus]